MIFLLTYCNDSMIFINIINCYPNLVLVLQYLYSPCWLFFTHASICIEASNKVPRESQAVELTGKQIYFFTSKYPNCHNLFLSKLRIYGLS